MPIKISTIKLPEDIIYTCAATTLYPELPALIGFTLIYNEPQLSIIPSIEQEDITYLYTYLLKPQ